MISASPRPAVGDLVSTYQKILELRARPAPLVPAWVPPQLPVGEMTISSSRRRGGYALVVTKFVNRVPIARLYLDGGGYRSLSEVRREFGARPGTRISPTSVRGHAGVLVRDRRGATLAWRERGVTYALITPTVRRVSVRDMRTTAARLDRLEGAWAGSRTDRDAEGYDRDVGGLLVTTSTTVSGTVEWGAPCADASGQVLAQRGGSATVSFLRRAGAGFRIGVPVAGGDPTWQGSIDGIVSATGVTLRPRLIGTPRFQNVLGETRDLACDPGGAPLTLASLRLR